MRCGYRTLRLSETNEHSVGVDAHIDPRTEEKRLGSPKVVPAKFHRPKDRRKLRQSQYKRAQLLMPVEKNRRPNRPPALLIKLFNPLSDSQWDSHVIRNFLTFCDFFLADDVNNGELDFRDIFFTILGKFQQCRESVLAEA